MTTEVVGRDDELGSVRAFLAEIRHRPRALVLSGEPGIGKTILWEAGIEEARDARHRILTCRGVEAEASLSFAGLSELLSPVLDETISLLVPPRQRALEVALLLAEPGDVAPDAHAIGLAVHDVVCTLAQRGPVVVAVDDMQWLDPASAHTMQIAFRRLQAERVGLLGTLRRTPERRVSSFELDGGFAEGRINSSRLVRSPRVRSTACCATGSDWN